MQKAKRVHISMSFPKTDEPLAAEQFYQTLGRPDDFPLWICNYNPRTTTDSHYHTPCNDVSNGIAPRSRSDITTPLWLRRRSWSSLCSAMALVFPIACSSHAPD